MADVPPDGVGLGLIPVMGQLDLGRVVTAARLAEKDEGEAAGLVVAPADLAEAESFTEEAQRGVEVADADHGVEVAHALP